MVPILRRDFVNLLLRNSPRLCKSRVPFSTSLDKKPTINPTVYDFLYHSHNFSPEAAAEAASVINRIKSRKTSDLLFSFLEKNDFSSSHLERIVKYNPSFLSADLEKSVKPKIKIFQELGLSNNDIADLLAGVCWDRMLVLGSS
ncbi:hypothetical protein AAHA92_23535 [Salvia divinorum]|uniref:Uncharacterized protein n=1 Tax=Salvia divinorum TaxID=28513 RepID=A0ABD1GSA2_SALDI